MPPSPAPKRKRRPPTPDPSPDAGAVLYIRGASPGMVAALDAWTEERRAELSAGASTPSAQRFAASFSRTDLLLDIIAAAIEARAASRPAP